MTFSKGPLVYENWKGMLDGNPLSTTYECFLYTDARIGSEIRDGFGPYKLLNALAFSRTSDLVPGIALRVDYHFEDRSKSSFPTKTDDDRYHGGGLNDEMAALISLCLGIRLKAGESIRSFDPEGDPKGRPEGFWHHVHPILIKNKIFHQPILPQVLGEHILEGAGIIAYLMELHQDTATALIKSARLYQDAIWLSESEPSLSWIMLVSAIEVAAGCWNSKTMSNKEALEYFRPDLSGFLLEKGDEALLVGVADHLSGLIGSQRKFVEFVQKFMPEAPQNRPPEAWRHLWETEVIESSLKKIYTLRSNALHGGIQFPEMMCFPAHRSELGMAEIPLGSASGAKGSSWLKEDTPMHLHLFEYIVRNVLLNWWQSNVG